MTETEFRFKHSEIIEYYQLIEMRLKGICAALMADGNKGWYERLAKIFRGFKKERTTK